ncbi:MAG: MotA/TolQ/ExbB proton channel family protein [Bacteroidaceae bacterium]|nr:MotA/TolQ/ExbB proton channel family protein [Bacteroidaceae bacterium]MBP5323309.1 MotA/TolQ/ExbB proton channel family protein [Bacteroidaceae bacterium]
MLFLQAESAVAVTEEVMTNPVLTEVVETGNKMNLWDMTLKGGWIMLVLAILSVICFYIFFERLAVLNKTRKIDASFMDRIRDYVQGGEVKSAINYCRVVGNPIANMIEKGLERLGRPASDIRAAIDNAGNLEVAKLEKGIPIMATIAGGAPMIGFLGTVIGMVRAFWEMANAGNNIDITLLSSGIYEAMITTVGGLIVGIIAMFAYNYLVSRVDSITNWLEAQTLSFMDIIKD